ncbi:hypothetical protein EUGRSUZ_G00909 [Eucalyptus grandis]|uniref:Uncharacterized protein n=2 Tax=Eucalyptus grandis TaxID=71139 RepID=A0ACC3K1N5_EUCGR|nr:hypothetical protein EUGRSUZ_G00909 [Eucalyptus grandis]
MSHQSLLKQIFVLGMENYMKSKCQGNEKIKAPDIAMHISHVMKTTYLSFEYFVEERDTKRLECCTKLILDSSSRLVKLGLC